jgi:predicted phosphodiesterase
MARQIAFEVSANAIIDTGDTTSFGIPAEKGFTDLLSDMGAPYYYAAGNHDSPAIREQIKRTKGVLPLGGRTYKVGAVTIAGIDDPTFSALQKADREKWTAQYKANDANTLALLDSTHPDLLAVHNPVMAKVALGKVPTIIAGHTHKYSIGTKKGTVLAVDGSSGATGLGSLISKATIPYAFEILRYKGTKLLAIDRVEFEGLEGRFSVERVLSGSLETEILDKLLDESEPEVLASTSLESPEDIDKQLASLGLSDAIEAETTEPDPATTVAPADGVTTTTTTTAGP